MFGCRCLRSSLMNWARASQSILSGCFNRRICNGTGKVWGWTSGCEKLSSAFRNWGHERQDDWQADMSGCKYRRLTSQRLQTRNHQIQRNPTATHTGVMILPIWLDRVVKTWLWRDCAGFCTCDCGLLRILCDCGIGLCRIATRCAKTRTAAQTSRGTVPLQRCSLRPWLWTHFFYLLLFQVFPNSCFLFSSCINKEYSYGCFSGGRHCRRVVASLLERFFHSQFLSNVGTLQFNFHQNQCHRCSQDHACDAHWTAFVGFGDNIR